MPIQQLPPSSPMVHLSRAGTSSAFVSTEEIPGSPSSSSTLESTPENGLPTPFHFGLLRNSSRVLAPTTWTSLTSSFAQLSTLTATNTAETPTECGERPGLTLLVAPAVGLTPTGTSHSTGAPVDPAPTPALTLTWESTAHPSQKFPLLSPFWAPFQMTWFPTSLFTATVS